ncbi:hypothetical protein DTL42_17065 [Bremerella cremea]|uniref:Carboxypeptidase regulatory-like domain-containing protein n=1 Tax=Bremerella cremea TaxID=1031537 RepID=A0A368KQB1_9BACT|nr:hypothetical protein [Bremerella cremea]RCS44632.1 hypothetical protein DTL42_17065 [Bremerella cremea]
MIRNFASPAILIPLLLTTVTQLGCQQESSLAVYPVRGTLTVNGEPAQGAILGFHPTQGDLDERGTIPAGKVKQDGTFAVSTFDVEDGAPAGEYKVTVFWPQFPGRDDPGDDRLRGKYALPAKSTTKVTITPGENKLPPIELKASNMLRGE